MPTRQTGSSSLIVSVGVQCHVGKSRTENQDRVTRAATPFGDVFVLADGVGGYQGGAEAAQATIDGFVEYLQSHGTQNLPEALQQAARSISSNLKARSAANHALDGNGSTVVLCLFSGTRVTYAHAGDSRLYLARNGRLTQLTRDHTVIQRLVSEGVLTAAQAREHPDASVLTRAIGQSADLSLDIAEIEVQPNDALLLCSDGLWAYATHEEMEAIAVGDSLSTSAVATALLNLALQGGGGDNISIQFLRFEAVAESWKSGFAMVRSHRNTLLVLAVASILGVSSLKMFIENEKHPLSQTTPNPAVEVSQTQTANTAERGAKPPIPSKVPAKKAKSAKVAPVKPEDPPKNALTIIEEENGSVAEWANKLESLNYLTSVRVTGDKPCLALERDSASLLYSRDKVDIAKRIQEDLQLPPSAPIERPRNDLKKCGNAEIVVMPAKPSFREWIEEKVKSPFEKVSPPRKKPEDNS